MRPIRPVLIAVLTIFLLPAPCRAEAYRLRYERMEGDAKITGHGTALCFEKGRLLTAAHNVSSGEPFIEVGVGWFKARVVRKDEDSDIALLECKEAEKWSPLAVDTPSPGKNVVLRGSKRGEAVKDFPGRIVKAWFKGRAQWVMEVDFDHGDSGAPIMFSKEVVVGMAVAGIPQGEDMDKTKALFLPTMVLWAFLLERP